MRGTLAAAAGTAATARAWHEVALPRLLISRATLLAWVALLIHTTYAVEGFGEAHLTKYSVMQAG
jgi:hypothetical protein